MNSLSSRAHYLRLKSPVSFMPSNTYWVLPSDRAIICGESVQFRRNIDTSLCTTAIRCSLYCETSTLKAQHTEKSLSTRLTRSQERLTTFTPADAMCLMVSDYLTRFAIRIRLGRFVLVGGISGAYRLRHEPCTPYKPS